MRPKNISKQKALQRLGNLLLRTDAFEKNPTFSGDFERWQRDVRVTIENLFPGKPQHVVDYDHIGFKFSAMVYTVDGGFESAFRAQLARIKGILVSMSDEIRDFWPDEAALSQKEIVESSLARGAPSPNFNPRTIFV